MKQKGYVYGLLVFLIFVAVFIKAITNMKSVSVMQASNYDRITMMKISHMAKNLQTIWPSINPTLPDAQARCTYLENKIRSYSDKLPFEVSVDCPLNGPKYVMVRAKSGRYNSTIRLF